MALAELGTEQTHTGSHLSLQTLWKQGEVVGWDVARNLWYSPVVELQILGSLTGFLVANATGTNEGFRTAWMTRSTSF